MSVRLFANLPCHCSRRMRPEVNLPLQRSTLSACNVCWLLQRDIRAPIGCVQLPNTPLTSDRVGMSICPKSTKLVPRLQKELSNASSILMTLSYRETGAACAFHVAQFQTSTGRFYLSWLA